MAAEIHPAQDDTTATADTLDPARRDLAAAVCAPTRDAPAELTADKGYHGRAALKELDGDPRIGAPWPDGLQSWRDDVQARQAVHANWCRSDSVGQEGLALWAEQVEQSFQHVHD